jgi:hypothetical protein
VCVYVYVSLTFCFEQNQFPKALQVISSKKLSEPSKQNK